MIRIGMVGCGRILNAHLQAWKTILEAGWGDIHITALVARKECDALMFLRRGEGPTPRPPVLPPASGDPLAAPHTYLSDFQDTSDVEVFTDYREMIARNNIDAVNDQTTLSMHHQVGLASLAAGKHLLTQKPFAITVKAGQRMVDLARERGLTLGVHEVVRNFKATRAARWAVRRGLIGRPQLAVIGSLGGLWSPDRVVAETPWRHRKLEGGGGGSLDIGVHQMHWLRYVMGEVAWVSAVTRILEPERSIRDEEGHVLEKIPNDVDDTYLAVAGFENDSIAQMLWSWSLHGEPLTIPGTPAFYGSEGCIKGNEIIHDDGTRESLSARFDAELDSADRERFFPHGITDAFTLQQLDWVRAIERGTDPETSGEEGLRDVAAAYAMLESAEAGRRVTLGEVLSGEVSAYQAEIDEHYKL